MNIAFDVDGTLIDKDDKPIQKNVELLKALAHQPNTIIVWSGGGKQYAELWIKRLGIENKVAFVCGKLTYRQDLPHSVAQLGIDIAIDDQSGILLGKHNITVA